MIRRSLPDLVENPAASRVAFPHLQVVEVGERSVNRERTRSELA